MAELNKNYKCSICGNVVKVVEAGSGALVCCGQPMEPVGEPTTQASSEPAASQPEVSSTPSMGAATEPSSNPDANSEFNQAPNMGAADVNETPATDMGMGSTGNNEETDINQ